MCRETFSRKVGPWLHEKTGCTLQDLCRKFNYPARETKIMGLDETDERKSKIIISRDRELKSLYLEAAKDKQTISRKGDNRSFTEYFKDLIAGWIFEDITLEMLRRQGIEIEHNGKDSKRVIALGSKVCQDADFIVKVGDCSRKVELTSEFNTFLEQNGFIEKRSPCLPKLYSEKGIWVYRDIRRGKYVLIDFATENVVLHLRHHDTVKADWAKDVNRYVLAENGKKEREDRMLAAELISIVGCSIDGREQPKLQETEDTDSPPKVFAIGGVFREKKESPVVVETKKEEPSPPAKKKAAVKEKAEPPKPMDDNNPNSEYQNAVQHEEVDYGDDFV